MIKANQHEGIVVMQQDGTIESSVEINLFNINHTCDDEAIYKLNPFSLLKE